MMSLGRQCSRQECIGVVPGRLRSYQRRSSPREGESDATRSSGSSGAQLLIRRNPGTPFVADFVQEPGRGQIGSRRVSR